MRNCTVIVATIAACLFTGAVSAAELPPIPKSINGYNQYSVGPPELLSKFWPMTDDEMDYLKSKGCNVVRFPLYPAEIGVDPSLMVWKPGELLDQATLDKIHPDWRSLDALMERLQGHGLTPYICPSPENGVDWSTKTWMALHVPESAQRAIWFTKLVVEHVHERFGDNVIYGWFENWHWNSYKHPNSTLFPAEFRKMLRRMYGGRIADLNRAWKSSYESFDSVEIPVLLEGSQVPESAMDSRRTYDLRLATDLMQREVLSRFRRDLRRIAPGAMWAGGCVLGELGGMFDTMSYRPQKTDATMRTCAMTSDVLAVDIYAPKSLYYSFYRLAAKIAAAEHKRFLVAEAPGLHPEAFGWIADVGGPLAGILVWAGKEDTYGLIDWGAPTRSDPGKRRESNIESLRKVLARTVSDKGRYDRYIPGSIHVYVPDETWNYSITRINHVEAFTHICDFMRPDELEPVLTEELAKLPKDVPIFVLEKTLPRQAIDELKERGKQVICPHRFFIDESGNRIERTHIPHDFFAELRSAPGGPKLLDAFTRVDEKERDVTYGHLGGTVVTCPQLAEKNVVIDGRPNSPANLIDGSVYEGVTLADKDQDEVVEIRLGRKQTINGAFVQLYEGDGQMNGPSRRPVRITLSASTDGRTYTQIARIDRVDTDRPRVRFRPVEAEYIRFDFGHNPGGKGLRIVEVGVLGKSPVTSDQ